MHQEGDWALANIKSAIKRAELSKLRREKNVSIRSAIRTAAKRVEAAVASGNSQEAEQRLRQAASAWDKAAVRGKVHPSTAARKKSRLAKKVLALQSSPAGQ